MTWLESAKVVETTEVSEEFNAGNNLKLLNYKNQLIFLDLNYLLEICVAWIEEANTKVATEAFNAENNWFISY